MTGGYYCTFKTFLGRTSVVATEARATTFDNALRRSECFNDAHFCTAIRAAKALIGCNHDLPPFFA